ncbi:unnamed protein product, partial [Urochloa humidicola]
REGGRRRKSAHAATSSRRQDLHPRRRVAAEPATPPRGEDRRREEPKRRRPPNLRPLLHQRYAGAVLCFDDTKPAPFHFLSAGTTPPVATASPSSHTEHHLLEPVGSSEDPEVPDYFDDVDYAEEKD